MSLSLRRSVAVLAAGATIAVGAPRALSAQQAPFSIAGTWRLNREKTERPKETQLRDPESVGTTEMSTGQTRGQATRSRGGSAGGGGGALSGTEGGGGGRGMVGGAVGLLLRAAMQPADSLLISQDETMVSIDPGNGYLLALQLDGTAIEVPQPDGTIHKTRVTLKKDQLIVERDLTTAGSTREIYRLDKNNPNQMSVEFKYENKRQRRTMEQKRVYDKGA